MLAALPLLKKAYDINDPLFLWMGQQIMVGLRFEMGGRRREPRVVMELHLRVGFDRLNVCTRTTL